MKTQKAKSGKLDLTKFKVSELKNLTTIIGGDGGDDIKKSKNTQCVNTDN